MIEVTVVIPTRDRWPLLEAHALRSALGQEDVQLEVIVVDDGSKDATAARLARVDDERVRVLRNVASRGVAAARNAGIEAAQGEWIALLDDDDLWSPYKLRRSVDALAEADWGYASAVVVDPALNCVEALPLPDPEDVARGLAMGNVVPGGSSNVMIRTRVLRQLGGFDESLVNHTEDWDLWIRLAQFSLPVAHGDVLVATLRHPGRSALRGGWEVVEEANRLLAKHGPVTRSQRLAVAEWLALSQHRGGKRVQAAGLFLRAAITYRSPGNLPPALGALFGQRGMRIASRSLHLLGGGSHVDESMQRTVVEPEWLALFRAGVLQG